MEQTECSEMSAYKIQKPGNYPEDSIQHSEHGKSLKSRIPFIVMCNGPTNALVCNKTLIQMSHIKTLEITRHATPHKTTCKTNECMLPHNQAHHV
jgi:hypothetical protein